MCENAKESHRSSLADKPPSVYNPFNAQRGKRALVIYTNSECQTELACPRRLTVLEIPGQVWLVYS